MRRAAIALGAAAFVVVAGGVAAFATGRVATYDLYTHCGVRFVDVEGARYYADPPLGDGNGNPPAGWGNPTDTGLLVMRDADTIYFVDWLGHHAVFSDRPNPGGGHPALAVCS